MKKSTKKIYDNCRYKIPHLHGGWGGKRFCGMLFCSPEPYCSVCMELKELEKEYRDLHKKEPDSTILLKDILNRKGYDR